MVIVTLFRSRLREGVENDYQPVAQRMSDIVSSMPGFVDQKFYQAPDGERVTIVRFADRRGHDGWAHHPEHLEAQRRGREEFYTWYDISVSEELYQRVYVDALDGATLPG